MLIRRIQIILLTCLALIFSFGISCSQIHEGVPEPKIEFSPKHYICYRTNSPLKIDGKLDEPVWQDAVWSDQFVDIEGDLKPKPTFKTQIKILWDDTYIYYAVKLEEPHVWATLKKRDSIIFYDNDFEIFIDPDGDTHRYYELEVNAFETAWDLFLDKPYRDNCVPIYYWDIRGLGIGVSVDGTINQPDDIDKGWTLEIAIPWDVIKESAPAGKAPKSGDQWRMNFSRVEWQVEVKNGKYLKKINPETGRHYPENNWVWSPQGIINMHYPELWGFVQFSSKVAGKGTDEFKSNPDEDVKWALRQIYYKQRNYYAKHGKFTTNISKLNIEELKTDKYNWPPKIEITDNLFEVQLKSSNKKRTFHISQDGRVW